MTCIVTEQKRLPSASGHFPICIVKERVKAPKRQGLYSFEVIKFHDRFQDLFMVSMTLGHGSGQVRSGQVHDLSLSNIFQTLIPCLRVFFYITQFIRHKLWCPLKSMPFNYSSLSDINCPCFDICSI